MSISIAKTRLANKAYETISAVSGAPLDQVLDPSGRGFEGRHDYALSENEDRTILRVERMCRDLFARYDVSEDKYEISHDAFGSLFVKYLGSSEAPAIAHGSHVDSVMQGGLYDGLSGIASGLLFLERLIQCGQLPKVPFIFIAFRSEEASPVIAYPCLGSTIATGSISESQLTAMQYGVSADSRVPLSEHFIQRYGAPRWSKVLAELKAPPLQPEKIAYFLEVHPSQGRILQEMGSDLGIVVGGIGGMQNREVTIPAESIKRCTLSSPAGLASLLITVTGRADHTGSALHNSKPGRDDRSRARIDALIGTHKLIQLLTQNRLAGESVSSTYKWGVVETMPTKVTGFTTVPFSQRLRFVAESASASEIEDAITKAAAQLLAEDGVEICIAEKSFLPAEKVVFLDPEQLSNALSIAAVVEHIASSLASDDESGALGELSSGYRGGLVRGTVTDFSLCLQSGGSFKVNLRKGENNIGKVLVDRVSEQLSALLERTFGLDLEKAGKILSDFAPSAVDPKGVAHLAAIANELGLNALQTPSMPAHDIGRLISDAVGIAGNMLFLTDEGGSHVPTELVRPQHMADGLRLAHSYLARKLGVELLELDATDS